ncbi:MAG: hypothetical protein ISS89_04490 [Candidatus Omnitrophica bacterium]|nr:hypothetical protein [Candidatus Omnitrophota bacterium]
MKKLLFVLAVLIAIAPISAFAQANDATEFVVYSDRLSRDNHYVPSGWMGDYGDIKMNDQSTTNPHSGTTCIEFTYSGKRSQGQGWAGVYWQNPANNWGNKQGGFNLEGMTKLTFWARGDKGGEAIQKVMVGGIKGVYPDSLAAEMGPIELSDTWKQYTVNLAGNDLSYVNGGFGWATTSDLNPEGCTFYIDDIKFEADPAMQAESRKAEGMPFYVYADGSAINNHFIPSGWMGDYGDLKYDGNAKEDPYLGDTCIKIIYSGQATQGARWAGMYWQNPANNWGNVDAGYDLSKAGKLTFWARGEKGGERIEEFKIGGIMGEYSDSDSAVIGPVILNKEWAQYNIDLNGRDMSYVIGGFCWAANIDNNPSGAVFYLDEIKFE